MQLRIKHVTGYRYETGAVASFNEARMTPLTTTDQMVLRSRLEITPTPWASEYRDYWGSTVTAFEVNEPHTELTVVATSIVETSAAETQPERRSWEALDEVQDEWCEYLEISHWVAPSPALMAELAPIRADAATPTDYAEAVCAFLHDRIRYVEGATEVTTDAADAWEVKAGVCQDFAHLALVLLRRNGIAARYVSGYLFAPPEGREEADSAEVETHAWLEALVPPAGDGGEPIWVGIDPTNRCLAGERYVKIGHGRHYRDVPPIKGVYRGTATAKLDASVRMHRTDAAGARV